MTDKVLPESGETKYLKPHTCEICGAAFIGGERAKYCSACRVKRDREAEHRALEKRREREKLTSAEGAEPKPATSVKKKKGPNTKQCRGCGYWQKVTGLGDVTHFCHYNLYTEKCREKDGDRCLSKSAKAVKPKSWPEYQTGDSIYAGYGRSKKSF